MPFMQREITEKTVWIEVDGPMGREWIYANNIPYFKDRIKTNNWGAINPLISDDGSVHTEHAVWENSKFWLKETGLIDYLENTTVWYVKTVEGYGARLSAPGYMDRTEWSVFDTEKEASEYLDEYYPEDEETE